VTERTWTAGILSFDGGDDQADPAMPRIRFTTAKSARPSHWSPLGNHFAKGGVRPQIGLGCLFEGTACDPETHRRKVHACFCLVSLLALLFQET
jgi:hypothetical protein